MTRRHKNPVLHFAVPALGVSLAAAIGLRCWLGGPFLMWWLIAINIVTFGMFGWDKRAAAAGDLRVPESVLLGLVALGGPVGAYCGARAFRHKTQKATFRMRFWLIVGLQAAGAVWYFTNG